MVLFGISLRERVPLALLCKAVDESRNFEFLCPAEHPRQRGDIVPVDGAEVEKAHVLKEALGIKKLLMRFLRFLHMARKPAPQNAGIEHTH